MCLSTLPGYVVLPELKIASLNETMEAKGGIGRERERGEQWKAADFW